MSEATSGMTLAPARISLRSSGLQIITLPLECRLPRMDAVLEVRKALPRRLRRVLSADRHIDRRFDRAHRWNIARAVRKDRARGHTNDELCTDGLGQQRIVVTHAGASIAPQPPWLVMHRDEQQADIGIRDDVAEALEHAVAVIVRECDLGRPGDAHKARRPALERAIGPALGVRRRQEEIRQAFDELLVVRRKFLAHQFLSQPIGNPAAVEPVLQLPVTFVIHDALSHGVASSSDWRAWSGSGPTGKHITSWSNWLRQADPHHRSNEGIAAIGGGINPARATGSRFRSRSARSADALGRPRSSAGAGGHRRADTARRSVRPTAPSAGSDGSAPCRRAAPARAAIRIPLARVLPRARRP